MGGGMSERTMIEPTDDDAAVLAVLEEFGLWDAASGVDFAQWAAEQQSPITLNTIAMARYIAAFRRVPDAERVGEVAARLRADAGKATVIWFAGEGIWPYGRYSPQDILAVLDALAEARAERDRLAARVECLERVVLDVVTAYTSDAPGWLANLIAEMASMLDTPPRGEAAGAGT